MAAQAADIPENEPRALHEIARDIRNNWRDKNGKPRINYAAEPYLAAMAELGPISDMYGCDTGKSIVIYFLGNATTWRGDDARRIKAELKALYT